ncbi:MAG: energy transducer TonB [Firmicutes bacterium]|nr:energy transducer TonB [Bacillota bacterium]
MIKNEWRDYQIAVIGSVVFHLTLFLIYFPNGLLRQEMNLKTYPVGMVSLSKGPGGLITDTPISENQLLEKKPPVPATKAENQPNRPKPVKNVPQPPKTNLSQDSIATADGPSPTEKPIPPVSGENSGDSKAPSGEGSGSTAPPSPRSLGNGEGKVFQMGALPPYPKNALNEGIQGAVGLRILVFANGGLERIELLSSSGDSRLDNAARRAVNNWRFQPESDAYYIDIVFDFDLKNGVSVKFIKAGTRP